MQNSLNLSFSPYGSIFGYVILKEGVKVDQQEIEVVKSLDRPSLVAEVFNFMVFLAIIEDL